MSGLASFAVLVVSMGVGTLVCGLIPLSLPLSRRALRVLEVFSAGLLVGAAVTVVIPEGAKALFEATVPGAKLSASAVQLQSLSSPQGAAVPSDVVAATSASQANVGGDWAWSFIVKRQQHDDEGHKHESEDDHDHQHNSDAHASIEHLLGSSILCGFVLMFVIDQLASGSPHSHEPDLPADAQQPARNPDRPRPEAHRLRRPLHSRRSQVFTKMVHDGVGTQTNPVSEGRRNSHKPGSGSRSSGSDLENMPDDYDDDRHTIVSSPKIDGPSEWPTSPRLNAHLQRADSSAPLLPNSSKTRRPSNASAVSARSATNRDSFRQVLTTLIGLLIHAFADGIAMGASAGSGDRGLTLIVFFAIMVHKAPAAFGLCTLLISQKLSRTNIRKGVAVFSLASPLGALTTYLLISVLFSSGAGIDAKHIGIALLFSGGTFLFVAMHAVLELAGADADLESVGEPGPSLDAPNGGDLEAFRSHVRSMQGEREMLGKALRIALVIVGAWTPRILQQVVSAFGGGHHH